MPMVEKRILMFVEDLLIQQGPKSSISSERRQFDFLTGLCPPGLSPSVISARLNIADVHSASSLRITLASRRSFVSKPSLTQS